MYCISGEKYEIPRWRMHDTDIPYWRMCDHSWRRMIHGTVTHVVGGLTVNSEPPPLPPFLPFACLYLRDIRQKRIPCLFMPRHENHDLKGTYKNREGKKIRTGGSLLHVSATLFDMQPYQDSDPRAYLCGYSERGLKRSHE